MTVRHSPQDVRRYWLTVISAPLLSVFVIGLLTVLLSMTMPGTAGLAILQGVGMVTGLVGGFLIARICPVGANSAAAFTGLLVALMFWSLRLSMGATDGWGVALAFALVIPCYIAGVAGSRFFNQAGRRRFE